MVFWQTYSLDGYSLVTNNKWEVDCMLIFVCVFPVSNLDNSLLGWALVAEVEKVKQRNADERPVDATGHPLPGEIWEEGTS